MFVSHRCRFILFPDPLGACPWLGRALQPWLDQPIMDKRGTAADAFFFSEMSPAEAELAFDMAGYAFRSYTRIAIIQNPLNRMVNLYDRISARDKVWRMRRGMGAGDPPFSRWLSGTRPNGPGAAPFGGPRWRRFGAWSGAHWCRDYISHVVRAECAKEELTDIFGDIGIAPALGGRADDGSRLKRSVEAFYDEQAQELMSARYAWDLRFYRQPRYDLRLVA